MIAVRGVCTAPAITDLADDKRNSTIISPV
jgi:hypothetical protein